MKKCEWDESLETGISEIDIQHRILFNIAKILLDSLENNREDEVIDGISIITDIGFVSTYSCDDCDYYWEIEFVLVGITHNNTLYKLENVTDILEEINA
jgi:hypothetical protein